MHISRSRIYFKKWGGNSIILGNECTIGGNVQFAACEGKTILVGSDCQFAHNIQVWTTDHHPIFDLQHCRINEAKDVVIGRHVWIGMGTLLLKGSSVSDGSVLGAHSVVSGICSEEQCVYVGVPAKAVKKGVVWERRFEKNRIY